MKTIRFRVWDGRRMRSMDEENGPALYRGDVYDDWRAFEDGTPSPDAVAMLSTGLTDSAGREVFEGDVIGYDPRFETEPLPVVWEEGGFKLRGSYATFLEDLEGSRVVGHVYQSEFAHLRAPEETP